MRLQQILTGITAGLACLVIVLTLGHLEVVGPQPQTPDQEKLAQNLAALFRAARAVISDHQELINDKDKGDKGLTGEKVVELTKQNYKKATNDDLQKIDPSTHEGELMRAMLDAITQVMDKAQPLINKQGLGFKGFLPAVFGKQVADAFRASIGGKADIKLTAPKSYVRNRANMPDDWEDKVIETVFKARDFARGKAYAEMGEQRGKLAYRLMIPEYYAASCLSCHGEPKGERDITGGKKEGAKLDELGGAISVAIYAK